MKLIPRAVASIKIKIYSCIPFFQATRFVRKSGYAKGIKEFLICLFAAWMPVLIGATIFYLQGTGSFIDGFYRKISSGEIFIYICSIIGALVYLLIEFHERNRKLPDYTSFLVTTTIILIVSLTVHILKETGTFKNTAAANITAAALYLISLILWFLSIIYRNIPESVDFQKNTKDDQEHIKNKIEGYEE